jgi:hypothetical protein
MTDKMSLSEIATLRPRRMGLRLVVIGGLLVLVNIGLIVCREVFFDKLFAGGFTCISVGVWILATGKTYPKGTKAPIWWNIGALLFTLASLASGIYLSETIGYRNLILL